MAGRGLMRLTGFSHRLICRGVRAAALVAIAHVASSILHAASPAATVVAVEPSRVADVILLRGGFDSGLRQGMVCRVTRGPIEIGEVLLVELRAAHSAALILSVVPKQSIRAGDVASIKTLKT
jgi:hypothetical protein